MAESQAAPKQEDQLTCAICLDAFKDPKLLQCFHVYCKDCLKQLVVKDQQGQLSLRCPTCRQSTLLPPTATDVSSLQSAFHIHHLLEIQEALKKVKDSKKVKCEMCNKDRPATSYCRDCGNFICTFCTTVHSDWDAFAKHEVVALEQLESRVKQLDVLKKVTLYCSLHQGKELELYCETCEELICHNCTVNKHCRPEHKYDLVSDTFERHKTDIAASLEPVKEHLGLVNKQVEQLGLQSCELNDQRAAIKADIHQQIQQLIEILQARKTELICQVDQHFQMKLKNLTAQKDELETVQAHLVRCLSFINDSLKRSSQGEMMKMKQLLMKQIKEVKDNFKPACGPTAVKFTLSPEIFQACRQFGDVYLQKVAQEKCYATGRGVEVAEPGERATAVLHVVDNKGKAYTTPVETVTCELVSEKTGEKTDCSVKKMEDSQYEISYQPTSQGRYQLHIKVEDEHIKGSPFPVTVIRKVSASRKPIEGMDRPRGVAINKCGGIVVVEGDKNCISIFSPTGEKRNSFGSYGTGDGQFNGPRGVAVDSDGNILVADVSNNRIQKFTSNGTFIKKVGEKGKDPLEFYNPVGIAIHPLNNKVYVADNGNCRVQILNPDLTFSSTIPIGSRDHDSDKGLPQGPDDIAFDSTGNVYVACVGDSNDHCVEVFTVDEHMHRGKIGKKGDGNGELNWPRGISIDSNDVVYVTEWNNCRVSVFTCEGKFLESFGTEGSGPGQFNVPRGIAVDKDGLVYVSDTYNNRLQIF